jgi:alkylhydroperoxidase/carboxymuconolactone decarboxylase family protein YurZ
VGARGQKRDRSLITVAALIAGGITEQLRSHLVLAKTNGLTEDELKEMIIHLAFYTGWPRSMSAIQLAKAHLLPVAGNPDQQPIGVRLTCCRPTNRFTLP